MSNYKKLGFLCCAVTIFNAAMIGATKPTVAQTASNNNNLTPTQFEIANSVTAINGNSHRPLTSVTYSGRNSSQRQVTTISNPINGGIIKRGDRVEYTINLLSSTNSNSLNSSFCYQLPPHNSFEQNSFGVGKGIALTKTVDSDSNMLYLTNTIGDDPGQYFPPGTEAPATCNSQNQSIPLAAADNLTGAIFVNLVPNSINLKNKEQVTLSSGYRFVRFFTTVD